MTEIRSECDRILSEMRDAGYATCDDCVSWTDSECNGFYSNFVDEYPKAK